MIAGAELDAPLAEMIDEAAEGFAAREEESSVIQTKAAAATDGFNSGQLLQFEENGLGVLGTESGEGGGFVYNVQPDHLGIELERTRKIGNGEPDFADVRAGGKTISRRMDADFGGGHLVY